MDVAKQVSYWRDTAAEDMETAELLFEKERYRHALFLAHLAIEKMLKAHVTKNTSNVPPKIHNLLRLARLAGISADAKQNIFFETFDQYQLEGRYPESVQPLKTELISTDFTEARSIFAWLNKLLAQQ
jgi:AbiV family abortive infection protein